MNAYASPKRTLRDAIILHFIFAGVAIVLNVVSQMVTVAVLPRHEWTILFSILVGTGVGLVAKYLLDKFVIYNEQIGERETEVKNALIYTFSGAFTTALFWLIEYGFHVVTQSDFWRYVGAVIGLTIGYTIKFFIDRKYVFDA